MIIESKRDFLKYKTFVDKHSTFVVKVVNSSMGKGVWLRNSSKVCKRDFNDIISFGKVLLEECIEQREEMSYFNSSSVNTVRVATYLT